MRRALVAVGLLLFSLTACGTGDPGPTPTQQAGPIPSATDHLDIADLPMDIPTACMVVDGAYATLGPDAQAALTRGRTAESKGDTAGVQKALDQLKPIFTSTSDTLADASGKVTDPEVKAALKSLSDSVAKAATFKSFVEFQSLAVLTAAPEGTMKKKCAEAGYKLQNLV